MWMPEKLINKKNLRNGQEETMISNETNKTLAK